MAPIVTVRRLEPTGRLVVGDVGELERPFGDVVTWVDVLHPDEEMLTRVAGIFGLHPLAVEDCLHYPQLPKIDRYDEELFLVWVAPLGFPGSLEKRELDIFLGRGWLVTIHAEELSALDAVAADAGTQMARGMEWVMHSIIDRLVDDILPIVDGMGEALEQLQDEMLEVARPHHLEVLFGHRRELLELHKTISPSRDVLRTLVREEDLIGKDAYRYFQDVGDHLARVSDLVETYREVAASAMDIYLSAQSNRTNVIMKHLTVVATIFMPLTLITGIYGMNFEFMPELGYRFGYAGSILAMLLIAGGMLIYFRRRDWW